MGIPLISLTKKDFQIEYFCGSGNGGQHRNRRKTAVRIRHLASGQEATCCDERSQGQNLRKAFENLSKKMIQWLRIESLKKLHEEKALQASIERQMSPENLKIEELIDGQWVKMEECPEAAQI